MTKRRFASVLLMAAAVLSLGGTSIAQSTASAVPARGVIGIAAVQAVDAGLAPMPADMCGHSMMIRAAKVDPRS